MSLFTLPDLFLILFLLLLTEARHVATPLHRR